MKENEKAFIQQCSSSCMRRVNSTSQEYQMSNILAMKNINGDISNQHHPMQVKNIKVAFIEV